MSDDAQHSAGALASQLVDALAGVSFHAPEKARLEFERISKRVSASLLAVLVPLLAETPNPDAALNLLERLLSPDSFETLRLLERNRQLLHYVIAVFGNSQYLGDVLIQNPDLLHSFLRADTLDRVFSVEDFAGSFARFRSRSSETDTSLLLARFKRREYVRIVLRDVLGIATLAEVSAEISALTDALIEEALRICESNLRNRYGTPQHYDAENRTAPSAFTVLSLGKLGGNELNYSSDIDLLYVFEDGRDAETTSISAREFFIRLAQELTHVLGKITREGPVFRIDLRLRPRGSEGELAVPLGQALHYYGEVAQDWELQALIKVRHSAGNQTLARQFIRQVQPFVYRGEINFAAIETALDSLHKIKTRSRRGLGPGSAGDAIDVKIDRGGIRDIEFLVQCLQRVYGGTEPWLRSGGTLFSMQKLHDKGHLSGGDFHVLSSSYSFLRAVEHRLQFWLGQQTHTVPVAGEHLSAIYRSLTGQYTNHDTQALARLVREHMSGVTAIYERVVHHQQTVQKSVSVAEPEPQAVLARQLPERVDTEVLNRLSIDSPSLYELANSLPLGSPARRNFHKVLSAAATDDYRYSVLVRHADLLQRALPALSASSLVTDLLVQHPEDLIEVARALQELRWEQSLSTRSRKPSAAERVQLSLSLADANTASAGDLSSGELRDQSRVMSELRSRYRRQVLRCCLKDFLQPRPVWLSLRDTTQAADMAVRAAFAAVGALDEFAVFALGRLGSEEFDVLSDADLLFVHGEGMPVERAAAVAADLVTLLGSYTNEGIVFMVDSRLRPHGTQGELVTTAAHLGSYFQSEAQAWEALSYTKLRHLAGSVAVADKVYESVRQLHARFAAEPEFRRMVREMRARLEKSVEKERNLKKGMGGFYDIDFIAGTLSIENALPLPAVNIMERLEVLRRATLLEEREYSILTESAEFLRSLEHSLRMVYGWARKSPPSAAADLLAATGLMQSSLGRELPGPLPEAVAKVCAGVRTVFDRILRL